MGFIGIDEIFLEVEDLDRALGFYHRGLGIPLDKHNEEYAYLQCERSHLVLQVKGRGGRHSGGKALHFALTVTEDTFDDVVKNFVGTHDTRGPMGERGTGRVLFIMDPDGNEFEVNTRYLYGVPKRSPA